MTARDGRDPQSTIMNIREIYNFLYGTVTAVVTDFRTNLKTSETRCLRIYLKGDIMNDPTPDVKIDKPGIVQQITDHVVTELVSALMPDDKSRKLVSGMMKIHRKYGIDSTTSLKILMDLAELTKED